MKKGCIRLFAAILTVMLLAVPLTSCVFTPPSLMEIDEDSGGSLIISNAPPEKDTGAYKLTDKTVDSKAVRPHYNMGINKRLEGDILVVLFYMNDNESRWTTDEIHSFTNEQVQPVLDFLEAEAQKWDVKLNFKVTEYSSATTPGYRFKYDGTVVRDLHNSPTGSTKDLIWHECVILGYPTYTAMNEYFCETYDVDEVMYFSVINASGVSYARNSITDDIPGQDNYPENSIIFSHNKNSNGGELKYGERMYTVATVLLYLYGAQNMDKTDGRDMLSAVICPDDIMYATYTDYTRFSLDDYTAYCIGWSDEIPDICYYDSWWK